MDVKIDDIRASSENSVSQPEKSVRFFRQKTTLSLIWNRHLIAAFIKLIISKVIADNIQILSLDSHK